MIIGSGLLASAFADVAFRHENVCIYAAGVSNSSCVDELEFIRERQRLGHAMQQAINANVFVYFGTCSVADPDVINTPYVRHKLEMERLVHAHSKYLILRLPQVVGKSSNPHTLLNFLYEHISRGESFNLWGRAKRNIIDVNDVALITKQLIDDDAWRNVTLNIANANNYSMGDIVLAMERVVGKCAIYDVVEKGSEYLIDISAIHSVLNRSGIEFGNDYLDRVIRKHFRSG